MSNQRKLAIIISLKKLWEINFGQNDSPNPKNILFTSRLICAKKCCLLWGNNPEHQSAGTWQVSGDLLDLHQHLKPGLALRHALIGQHGTVSGRQPLEDEHIARQQLINLPPQTSSRKSVHTPVVLQVGVEQVLQAVVQAEGDEEAVEVQAERGAVLRDGWRWRHHPSTLSQPPQQLLQVCQLLRDEQTPPGATKTHSAKEEDVGTADPRRSPPD